MSKYKRLSPDQLINLTESRDKVLYDKDKIIAEMPPPPWITYLD